MREVRDFPLCVYADERKNVNFIPERNEIPTSETPFIDQTYKIPCEPTHVVSRL